MKQLQYIARPQLLPFHARRQRRAVLVTHRRFGKTFGLLHDIRLAMLHTKKRRARFSYVAPSLVQAKDIAWAYVEEFFAQEVPGCKLHASDLTATFSHNGARLRLYGVENAERMRGTYSDGVALDEYGDFPPDVYPYIIRPTLQDRRGWAVFTGTPKGRTALWQVWNQAGANPDTWFRLMVKASESGLISPEELAEIRQEIGERAYLQEFECRFDVPVEGAYYGELLTQAEAEGRLSVSTPANQKAPIYSAWDIGVRDATGIWIWQPGPDGVLILDYFQGHRKSVAEYAKMITARGWKTDKDFVPHDAKVQEWGSGKTRLEAMREAGLNPEIRGWKWGFLDGIEAVRQLLPRCYFHERAVTGVGYLSNYAQDEHGKTIKPGGDEDPTHAADAFRYLALAYREIVPEPPKPTTTLLLQPDRKAYTIGPPELEFADEPAAWGIE